MYTVNMVDLQSSEYEELKLLVEAERAGDDAAALARGRLQPTGDAYEFDGRMCEVYRGLESAGLIRGVSVSCGFFFEELTQRGVDFIDDYASMTSAEEKRTKEQRRHDYKVASYGAIAGGVLGLFSGALGGWLLSLVTAAASVAS